MIILREVPRIHKIHRSGFTKKLILLFSLVIILSFAYLATWSLDTINIEGSSHYSEEAMKEKVVTSKIDHNTLLFYLKNKYFKQESIPFIESLEVELVNKHTVNLVVYEKAIIGCVQYMDEYMYFDKDGIVVESSREKLENIPYIVGLSYDKIILHEKLVIKNDELYDTILNLAQLIKKFDIEVDKISFNLEEEATLYTGGIKVLLGKSDTYDIQLAELKNILPMAEGLTGTFDLKNYKSGQDIIFNKE